MRGHWRLRQAVALAVAGGLPWLFTMVRPPAVQAAAPRAVDGWDYVMLPRRLGPNVNIVGLSEQHGRILATVQRERVAGIAEQLQFWTATWTPGRSELTGWKQGGGPAVPYAGPIRLVFPSQLPRDFAVQPVTIETVSRGTGTVIARWPSAVPAYGSDETPQVTIPGLVDNQILAQEGGWLWIAMKGPQYPPLYPHAGPLSAGFRYWNRLIALNLVTGAYRVYRIPRTYALQQSPFMEPRPALLLRGSEVVAAVGSWIGILPAPGTGTTSVPVRVPAPPAIVERDGATALSDLRYLYAQEANGLAAYWDSVMGRHVPGLPLYPSGRTPAGWNTDPVIFNHQVYPADLIWAMEFPFAPGSRMADTRARLAASIVHLLASRLNGYASSPVEVSYATIRQAFKGKPPLTLPGYTVRDNVYWPDSPAVLDRGVPTLPGRFTGYAQLATALSAVLSLRSAVIPELPDPRDHTPFSDILDVSTHQSLDLAYTLNTSPVPNGYLVTVSYGPPLPPNSPKIQAGNAELMFSTAGVLNGHPLPPSLAWRAHARFAGAQRSLVSLGHGIQGTLWSGLNGGCPAEGISWVEDGFTWTIPPAVCVHVDVVSQARREAARLAFLSFPLAHQGSGILGIGPDAPSEVVYHGNGTTYAVYATGWRAPEFAALMTDGR
jgi:hypothetical protein